MGASSSAPSTPGQLSSSQPLPANTQVAIVAGGCFWGVEELMRRLPGVVKTEAGYCGGATAGVNYQTHKAAGHAESVKVWFDPGRVSYGDVILKFFSIHDPSKPNRQGNDVGPQYRSAIFYTAPEQRAEAEAVIRRVNGSGIWKGKVITQVAQAGPWSPAEPEHQDYLQRTPGGYTCHFPRDLKLDPA